MSFLAFLAGFVAGAYAEHALDLSGRLMRRWRLFKAWRDA